MFKSLPWRLAPSLAVGAFLITGALLRAQDSAGCQSFFSRDREQIITITRDGAVLSTLHIPQETFVVICYDRLGPDGELIGNLSIRARRPPAIGERTGTSGGLDDLMRGAPLVMTLNNVTVTMTLR
jgi:hypothetical protein